jgi:hypothetical protein
MRAMLQLARQQKAKQYNNVARGFHFPFPPGWSWIGS